MNAWGRTDEEIYLNWTSHMLRLLKPGGLLACPAPTPFDAEKLRQLMGHLAGRECYAGQTVISWSSDGFKLTMVQGAITMERISMDG